MKTFHCTHCKQQVFSENVRCERCDSKLGYLEDVDDISAFAPDDDHDGAWRTLPADSSDRRYKPCHNYAVEQVCNRVIPWQDPEALCRSCRLTTTIPSLASEQNRSYWYKLERAKRRMLYTLAQLDLPIVSRHDDPERGLAFEFLEYFSGGPPVHTGHNDGLITINVAEADDAHRANARVQMDESYRTLLGHFRHEIGHYYFMRLMEDDSPLLPQCRELFGDDRIDYDAALRRHYDQGPPADWQETFISSYATMHPYEDWAETWAHYMHMVDTLETADACGMALSPEHPEEPSMPAEALDADARFRDMIARWFPLTYALNSLNRSMGTRDSYPFTLNPPVQDKLRFVHHVIRTKGAGPLPASFRPMGLRN